ncbi:radical SAM protein [Pseudodesulfovibrio sp.]|uniref:radical SAM protein n=1 Tax=unclassified Pseudodesulfovibrio TaxID=2661612 RepID=UPI003B0087A4
MNSIFVIKASRNSPHFRNRYEVSIADKKPLPFLVERLRQSKTVSRIILNTSDSPNDDRLVVEMAALGIPAVRGPYEDSLKRLRLAAEASGADTLVKISGNYPLLDIEAVDELVRAFEETQCRYAYNEHSGGVVLGLGAEAVDAALVVKFEKEIQDPVLRLVGTLSFRSLLAPPDILQISVESPRPSYRANLAVPEDVLYINKIISGCDQLRNQGIAQYLDDNPILVKYAQNNIEGPQEVGLEKLFLFPGKMEALLPSPEKNGPDATYPVSVELSLTNRCNLACKWCSDKALRMRAMEDLDISILKNLLEDLAANGTKGIVIEGGGEPTLYADFSEVALHAKALGLGLGLITNGVRLPDIEILKHFDWVRFSLDAASTEQFRTGKGKDYFQKVMANIQTAASAKAGSGLVVGIGYVLTSENEQGLEDLTLKLRRLGVDYLQIRPVIDHPDLMPKNFNLSYLSKHSLGGFSVAIHNMKENVITGNFSLPCRAHSLSSVITANGDVYLCGRLNTHEDIPPIGNLYKNSFAEIWNGQERRRQSDMVMAPKFCQQWCPECRLTKYNILLDRLSKIKTRNFV